MNDLNKEEFFYLNSGSSRVGSKSMMIKVIVEYKGMHSSLMLDLEEFQNKEMYLQIIKDHVEVAKEVIDRHQVSLK